MKTFIGIHDVLLLHSEFGAFTSLLLFSIGLVIADKDIIILSGSLNIITIVYFCIGLVNVRIQMKLRKMQDAMYNLPWYTLSLKQQKLLNIAMNCKNLEISFMTGNVYPVSLERFANVVSIVFKYYLILKEFI